MDRLTIVGMGYVGLPLGIAFDAEGYDVVGYDTDDRKVAALNRGDDPTGEVGTEAVSRSNITFTTDSAELSATDYYIITVPTPIDETGRPDLAYVEAAGETVGRHLTDGSTVVLESTVYPGATREVLLPVLERKSGRSAGDDFFVGYSPERLVPGSSGRNLEDIVKIVSGHDDTALERLCSLYDDVIDAGIHAAPTMETAEAAKCLENTQRDVNIALMNEFAAGCYEVDLPMEARDVIEAAATKWNFHEYHPGSVGGHCIPVDPNYLIWQFEQHGFESTLMQSARAVNDGFASQMARITVDALTERRRRLEGAMYAARANGGRADTAVPNGGHAAATDGQADTATPNGGQVEQATPNGGQMLPGHDDAKPRLLVLGFAYKPNTTDIRSPVLEDAVDQLQGVAEVEGIDPRVPNDRIQSRFDIPLQDELSVADFDGLLLATPHDQFRSLDLASLCEEMNELPVLVDVTGTYEAEDATEHGFLYRGL